jgi:hypothetical protein
MTSMSENLLSDREASAHESRCIRAPSTCTCAHVAWIWAERPVTAAHPNPGKWMLFPSTEDVDRWWTVVQRLLATGRLGDTAKVAPSRGNVRTHLICVYLPDSDDVKEVMRVLLLLRDELDLRMGLNYKTDEETINGHYAASSGRNIQHDSKEMVSMYTSPRLVQQQVAPATASLSPLLSSTSGATSHSASVCDDKVAVVELVRNNPTRQLIAIREPAADAHTPKVVRFLSPPQPYVIPSQRGQKRKGVSSAQGKQGKAAKSE